MRQIKLFEKIVKEVGGQCEMARRLHVSQSHVWNWINRDKKVPPQYVVAITKITEMNIDPCDLRPDVFPQTTAA